jgi:hypothetical protein
MNDAMEKTFEEADKTEPVPPENIVAYNELRSCADLYRLYSSGKLEIQPDFQREVVWQAEEQSRFIDSLVKQLPIPSMCFSLDHKTQKWKVIDGLQRMTSIIRFLGAPAWKLSKLEDIHTLLRGASNADLRMGDEERKRLYALVEDVSIPITVIRCDYSQSSHMRYLFTIFHRLNSGGVRLTNQEIRNCIYTGWFNSLLKKVDGDSKDWASIRRRIWGRLDRFRSVEALLRLIAFGENLPAYNGNLAGFLNDYMSRMLQAPDLHGSALELKVRETVEIASRVLTHEPKGKLPLVLIEALLFGIYVNIDFIRAMPDLEVKSRFDQMRQDPVFSESARYAVTSLENVKTRLGLAKLKFS